MASGRPLAEWSRAVRERDGCCQKCGATKALGAHHIKPKAEFPELRLDVSNGQTLCHNCHMEHHFKYPGKTKKPGVASQNKKLRKEVERLNSLNESNAAEIAMLHLRLATLTAKQKTFDVLTAWIV